MDRREVIQRNRKVYDAMADARDPLCRPATDAEIANPLATVDGAGWLGESIAGKNVLCLAAGGGRQSSLYAAAGANVTVVDISGAMLELDRRVAAERGYSFRLLETSMDDLSMCETGEFDIVIQPVSTCYLAKIMTVYQQVARVLRQDGLYVSQHKQPTSLQASMVPGSDGCYRIEHAYYRDSPIPPPADLNSRNARRLRESGAVEHLFRWEELIGGLCRCGFAVEDLTEPMHAVGDASPGTFAHRARFVAPYVRIKARRTQSQSAAPDSGTTKLWVPE